MTEKLLRFPKRFSLGGLYQASRDQPETWELLKTPQGLIVNPDNQPINWQWLDDASGDVIVPDTTNWKLQLKVSSSAASSLAPLENLPSESLHVLDLSRSQVMDLGLTHISHLESLRVLELAYTPISDTGLAMIARLKDLQSLGLTATNITNDGLVHIQSLTDLRELWLNGTGIDDGAIENLTGFNKLVILGLSGTKITDAALTQLSSLKSLLRLYLFNTAVTEGAIEELRKQIPALRVKWKRAVPQRPEFTLAEWVDLSLQEPSAAAPEISKVKTAEPLSEVEFWDIIDLLNWDEEGNDDAVIEPAIEYLAKGEPEKIYAFQEQLAAKLYALDGERYAKAIGKEAYQGPEKYFSRDWFLAARCCAVANGQDFFEEILGDPSKMPQDLGFAALANIAARAYRKKTGKTFAYVTKLSEKSCSNLDAWPSI